MPQVVAKHYVTLTYIFEMAIILFSLCAFPAYMAKLRAQIFGTDMHPYCSYTHRKNDVTVVNILKVTIFLKNFTDLQDTYCNDLIVLAVFICHTFLS